MMMMMLVLILAVVILKILLMKKTINRLVRHLGERGFLVEEGNAQAGHHR